MRSRLAITLMLVFGFALSGSGGALAISGMSSDAKTAGNAAYDTPGVPTTPTTPATPVTPSTPSTPTTTPQVPEETTLPPTLGGGVKGETEGGGTAPSTPETTPSGGVAPETQVQQVRQVGAAAPAESQLPFTGFAAIPILLIGIALVAAGLVLRRGTGRSAA